MSMAFGGKQYLIYSAVFSSASDEFGKISAVQPIAGELSWLDVMPFPIAVALARSCLVSLRSRSTRREMPQPSTFCLSCRRLDLSRRKLRTNNLWRPNRFEKLAPFAGASRASRRVTLPSAAAAGQWIRENSINHPFRRRIQRNRFPPGAPLIIRRRTPDGRQPRWTAVRTKRKIRHGQTFARSNDCRFAAGRRQRRRAANAELVGDSAGAHTNCRLGQVASLRACLVRARGEAPISQTVPNEFRYEIIGPAQYLRSVRCSGACRLRLELCLAPTGQSSGRQ